MVVAAVGVGAYFLSKHMGWPWWMALVIVASLAALVTLILFGRRIIYRRREEGFIKRVIEQEEGGVAGGPVFERRQVQELEARWKEAVATIKRSHLKRRGNPIYALPWYLMIGETGSGKTTAVRNSRLPSTFPELGHPAAEGPTRNNDWWFFDDCIILDTAGRYATRAGQGRDNDEWKKFLSLLSKYRRREPLNGLIVAVPANRLFKEHADEMEEYGRHIHNTIDQLMRVMGAKFPVYILVTKLDQVTGMNSFCGKFPWKALRQGMGNINRDLFQDHMSFLDQTMEAVADRLKDLRLLILQMNGKPDPSLLLFPDQIRRLRPGLAAFIRGVFQENPYQEPPVLRGIFFSSAHQEGTVETSSFKEKGVEKEIRTVLPGTNRGFFLQDLFANILPADRHLHSPIREYIRWSTTTRAWGFFGLAAVTVALAGLMSMSAFKNNSAIEEFNTEFPTLEGEGIFAEEIILNMDDIRKKIVDLEKLNRDWWIPKMGLKQSEEMEFKQKKKYRDMFNGRLLDPIDREMKNQVAVFDRKTPDVVVGEYIEHLVKRINLITAFLDNQGLAVMAGMPQPSNAVVLLLDKNLPPTTAAKFNDLYLYNLVWSVNREGVKDNNLKIKKGELISRLVQLIELKGENMEWLVAWVNTEEDLVPVTLADFWDDKVGETYTPEQTVAPAFTLDGKGRLEGFITQMEKALEEAEVPENFLVDRESVFSNWYDKQYIRAWRDFARFFIADEETRKEQTPYAFRTRSKWQDLAIKMTTLDNPYFDLMARMSNELKHLKESTLVPSWLELVILLQVMKEQVENEGYAEEGISFAKVVKEALETAFKYEDVKLKESVERHLKAGKEFLQYQVALKDISPVLDSKDYAYQMASQLFQENPDPTQSSAPFDAGYMATKKMEALIGKRKMDEDLFWDLLRGPLDLLLYYTTHEAACALQVAWEEQVLAEVQGVPEAHMQKELFGENGVVWNFVDNPAGPFLGRNQRSFYARESYGESIPFLDDFYDFLTEGAIGRHMLKSEYEVGIVGLPTDVNEDAAEKIQAVIVEMVCSSGVQRLENYNFPVSELFKWSPESCGGVKLEIRFRNLVLTRRYPNYTGLPEFLVDFRNGTRTFTPEEFPLREDELKKRNVKEIHIRFELIGHEPLIDLIERTPLEAPSKIVYCWK